MVALQPVELQVQLRAHFFEFVLENFLHVVVIWHFYKMLVSHVRQIDSETLGLLLCEFLSGGRYFSLLDLVILLFAGHPFHILPGLFPFCEVYQGVPDRF